LLLLLMAAPPVEAAAVVGPKPGGGGPSPWADPGRGEVRALPGPPRPRPPASPPICSGGAGPCPGCCWPCCCGSCWGKGCRLLNISAACVATSLASPGVTALMPRKSSPSGRSGVPPRPATPRPPAAPRPTGLAGEALGGLAKGAAAAEGCLADWAAVLLPLLPPPPGTKGLASTPATLPAPLLLPPPKPATCSRAGNGGSGPLMTWCWLAAVPSAIWPHAEAIQLPGRGARAKQQQQRRHHQAGGAPGTKMGACTAPEAMFVLLAPPPGTKGLAFTAAGVGPRPGGAEGTKAGAPTRLSSPEAADGAAIARVGWGCRLAPVSCVRTFVAQSDHALGVPQAAQEGSG
jgi:hypothetical protein